MNEEYIINDNGNVSIEQVLELFKINTNLQQENKQLKEQNEKEFADYIKFKQEQYDEYLDKTNKLIKERQHYKHIIDELEKWLNKTYEYMEYGDINIILRNSNEQMEEYGYFYNLLSIKDKADFNEKVRKKLQELKGSDINV